MDKICPTCYQPPVVNLYGKLTRPIWSPIRIPFFTYIVLFDDYYIETRKEDLTLQHTIKFDSHTESHALDDSVTSSLLECILVDRTRKWSEKDLLKLHLSYDVSKFLFYFISTLLSNAGQLCGYGIIHQWCLKCSYYAQ